MISEQQIKELAYAIWEQEGHPERKDLEYYFRAKNILEERELLQVIALAPPPSKIALDPPLPTVIELRAPLRSKRRSRKRR